MKSFINPKNSLDEFKQLISNYDQTIIQPVIDEILANFDRDLDKFEANEEAWQKLKILNNKLLVSFKILKDLINNSYVRELYIKDEINNFFKQNEIEFAALFDYKKIILDSYLKCIFLIKLKDNESKFKPIHFVVAFIHDAQTIKHVISSYELNVYDKSKRDILAIHVAAKFNNQVGLELLLNKYKFDINSKTSNRTNIIHFIVDGGHIQLLEKILLHNVDLNSQDSNGNTPLNCALQYQFPEIVARLIKDTRINFNIVNNRGEAIPFLAAKDSDIISFKNILSVDDFLALTKYKAKLINEVNGISFNLLKAATFAGHENMLRLLIEEYKINVNVMIDGLNALNCLKAQNNSYNIAYYLLKQGINIPLYCHNEIPIIRNIYKFIDSLATIKVCNHDNNIIGIINNWQKFDRFSTGKFTDQQYIDITESNEAELLLAKQTASDITKFFINRQEVKEKSHLRVLLDKQNYFDQLLCKSSQIIEQISENITKYFAYKKTESDDCIFWQRFENVLYHMIVIDKIMSGKIQFFDENSKIFSSYISNELESSPKICLFHKSKFIKKGFLYEGELIDGLKLNISTQEQDIIKNRTPTSIKNEYDLYPVNLSNYLAMIQWKNENLFKIIGVIKHSLRLSNCSDDTVEESEKQTELQTSEIKEEIDLAKMIWESIELLFLIASHISLEDYFNSLHNTQTSGHVVASPMTGAIDVYDLAALNF